MNDPVTIVMALIVLMIAIPVHEFAHALSAVNNGDDGPRREGRLTIFPWDHFDAFGAIFCVLTTISGIGLGWGRPVIVNPNVLHNPRWGMCKIAAWGPLSNLLLACAMAIPLRIMLETQAFPAGGDPSTLRAFMQMFVTINLGLMLFNLIPIGPLDGAKVLAAFLPPSTARNFMDFQLRYGTLILLGLILLGRNVLGLILGPPMAVILDLTLGHHWRE